MDEDSLIDMAKKVGSDQVTVGEVLGLFSDVRESIQVELKLLKMEVIAIWEAYGADKEGSGYEKLREYCIADCGDAFDADASVAIGWLSIKADAALRMDKYNLLSDIQKNLGKMTLIDSLAISLVMGMQDDTEIGSPSGAILQ